MYVGAKHGPKVKAEYVVGLSLVPDQLLFLATHYIQWKEDQEQKEQEVTRCLQTFSVEKQRERRELMYLSYFGVLIWMILWSQFVQEIPPESTTKSSEFFSERSETSKNIKTCPGNNPDRLQARETPQKPRAKNRRFQHSTFRKSAGNP